MDFCGEVGRDQFINKWMHDMKNINIFRTLILELSSMSEIHVNISLFLKKGNKNKIICFFACKDILMSFVDHI